MEKSKSFKVFLDLLNEVGISHLDVRKCKKDIDSWQLTSFMRLQHNFLETLKDGEGQHLRLFEDFLLGKVSIKLVLLNQALILSKK